MPAEHSNGTALYKIWLYIKAAYGMLQVKTVGDIVTLEPAAGSTATVLVADLSACKAVVHIIDTILIPKAVSTQPFVSPVFCNLCVEWQPLC